MNDVKSLLTLNLTSQLSVLTTADPRWQECLERLPHDFYHLPGYLELEARRSDAIAEAIAISDGEAEFFLPYMIRNCDSALPTLLGETHAVGERKRDVPKAETSARFHPLRERLPDAAKFQGEEIYDVVSPYGYPGILVNAAGQNPQFIKDCLNAICERWQQRQICSAFLRLHPLLDSFIDSSISTDRYVVCRQGDVVVCDLQLDETQLWQQVRQNHRTKIKKLQKSGFTASIVAVDSPKETLHERCIDVFIDIYRQTMDHRVNAKASYYFSDEYFHELVTILGDRAHICIVETEGQIVAANLITEFSGIVQYHLGGTKTEFLPSSPNTLAVYQILQWAKQRHNRYVNLGGDRDSLYHFKAGFSPLSRPFATIKTIVDADVYNQLAGIRAEALGLTLPEIQDESFFPVYRLN